MNYANHYKIDMQHLISLQIFFLYIFTYIKMSENLSAKYYQNSKERLQKKLLKDIKVFLIKKKEKRDNMVVIDTKYFPEDEKQNLRECRRKYYKIRKTCLIIIKETIILKSNELKKQNIRMFYKINFEVINLLQKANSNENIL